MSQDSEWQATEWGEKLGSHARKEKIPRFIQLFILEEQGKEKSLFTATDEAEQLRMTAGTRGRGILEDWDGLPALYSQHYADKGV